MINNVRVIVLCLSLPTFVQAMNIGAPVPRIEMDEDSFFSEQTYKCCCGCCAAFISIAHRYSSLESNMFSPYSTINSLCFPMACVHLAHKLGEDMYQVDKKLKSLIDKQA
jgi:hypothetical protein